MTNARPITVVQLDIAWESRELNHQKVLDLLTRNRPAPGSMVVLPEMFSSGFSMNVNAIAEDESRETERFLIELGTEFQVTVVAGIVTKSSGKKGLNQSLTISPAGEVIARYTKIHPFGPGKEHEFYDAGADVITFTWHEFTVAPFICYDLRFPEIFRLAMQRGANMFTVIASWPDSRIEHWITLLQARAIENQAYVIGVNRVGDDPAPLHYPGRSLIIDPLGKIITDAGEREAIASAQVSIDQVNSLREKFPALRDMKR